MLSNGEPDIDAFALEQAEAKMSKIDKDPLKEINHPSVILKENADRVEAPPKPNAEE